MTRLANRRTVLKTALGGLACAALPPLSGALAQSGISVTPLGDRLSLLTGAGANILALTGPDGLVLVDSGAADHTDAFLEALAGLSGGPDVHTLFNTHWHLDQTGGNEALSRAGARIVAHRNTQLRMSTPVYIPESNSWREPRPAAARPTEAFHTTGEMQAGGESIEYGYLIQAHTDGDIYVYFKDSNVIAVGDVVSPVRDPEHDWYGGGWLGGRVDSLERLLEVGNEDTRVIPSYGPVMDWAELRAEYEMMDALFERLNELARTGYSARDMYEAGVLDETGRDWDDPMRFLYDVYKGFWGHQNTLGPNVV